MCMKSPLGLFAAVAVVVLVTVDGADDDELPTLSSTTFPRGYYRFLSPSAVLEETPGGEEEAGEPVNLVIPELGVLQGTLRTASNGFRYSSFRGVPYAEPPVGERRFQPPEKQKPWKGKIKAVDWAKSCMQADVQQVSEDCLYLNIETPFTKQADKLLPILVEIHGGGYIGGSGNLVADALIRHGELVYVTMNYRLGAFGFLSTGDPSAPGNYGLMDQIAALTWVQAYAHYFGGDASRVTLEGGSAGAASVHQLILSPLARGLFHQAISHSGTALSPWALRRDPLSAAKRLADVLKCHDDNSVTNKPFIDITSAIPGLSATVMTQATTSPSANSTLSAAENVSGDNSSTSRGPQDVSLISNSSSTNVSLPPTESSITTTSTTTGTTISSTSNNASSTQSESASTRTSSSKNMSQSQVMVECLKSKTAEDILMAQEHFQEEGSAFHFVPTVDGYVIPGDPAEMLTSGDFANVTWITGNVRDEGVLFAGAALTDGQFMRTLDTSWETSGCRDALQIPATVGPDQARKVCQRVRNLYFQDRRIDFQSIYNLVQMTGDRWFNVPTMKSAFHHARKARVHLYLFAFQGRYAVINIINGIARKLGLPPLPAAVSHGDDYTYRSNSGNFTSHEGKIGEMYSGMIRHFVTTGEPRPSLPEYQISWRPFDPAKNDLVRQVYDDYVRLDTISDPMNLVNFWDSLNI